MTTLADLTLARVAIPLRRPFRHAAAVHTSTAGVWVEARSARGAVGYGEACPRPYVTGEDLGTVRAFFLRHRADLCARIGGVGDLIAWSEAHRDAIDRNPAAWCAIELALLDLLAKEAGRSVESLLGLPELQRSFRYSAVVGIEGDEGVRTLVDRYVSLGFADFKLKLSGDLAHDRARLAWFRQRALPGRRLRLDANNSWTTVSDAARHLEGLACAFFAVEEPLAPRRWSALAQLGGLFPAASIVLDESCTRVEDLRALDVAGRWIINVRVSKMGGILRALAVVDAARRSGVRVIVGAQVGETSVLSRAALTVAAHAGDGLVAQEGAFGTLLLAADVCDPPVMFGPAGELTAPAPAPGFGLTVRDRTFLEPLCVRRQGASQATRTGSLPRCNVRLAFRNRGCR